MPYSLTDFQTKVTKALDHLQKDLRQMRTGKASVQLLDSVRVEAYGSQMSLQEVAQVSAPSPDLLVIKPWDKGLLEAIEKSIQSADLNLQAVVDKDLVRIPVPPLTEERRKEMVKVLQQRIEEAKVMLRTIRGESKKDIEKQRNEDGISEDDIKRDLEELESELKKYFDQLESIFSDKKAELMTV